MQSTGQLDLQVPQAIQVSRIFLGIVRPPHNIYHSTIHILHEVSYFVNIKSNIKKNSNQKMLNNLIPGLPLKDIVNLS